MQIKISVKTGVFCINPPVIICWVGVLFCFFLLFFFSLVILFFGLVFIILFYSVPCNSSLFLTPPSPVLIPFPLHTKPQCYLRYSRRGIPQHCPKKVYKRSSLSPKVVKQKNGEDNIFYFFVPLLLFPALLIVIFTYWSQSWGRN